MRQALVSDIHGNIEALNAVMADIAKQSVDEIICLGDIVGYGPNPVECLELIMKKAKLTILGIRSTRPSLSMARHAMRPTSMSSPRRLMTRTKWIGYLPKSHCSVSKVTPTSRASLRLTQASSRLKNVTTASDSVERNS